MKKNISNIDRSEILVQALPYIRKYSGCTVVVKYGGNAMINQELKNQVMQDIVLLNAIGVNIVLVHGGGPEISEMLDKIGKKSEFIDGLRVTDAQTAEIVLQVLAGKVNKGLVNLLETQGGKAIGISGIDGGMIQAAFKDKKYGFVGKITHVDTTIIEDVLMSGYIPVISTVASDSEGNIYNINADTAAAYIAGSLEADRLIMMTDVPGILRKKDDPDTLIGEISTSDAKKLFKDGTISQGMIPKVECCITAIEKGVENVVIMDGRVPHSILAELLTDTGAGTLIKK